MRPNTRAVFFETPTNPVLELVDIEACQQDRAQGGRARRGRQCVRHAACCSGRYRSAPTSWSIPRPSISTARGAASAAWCSAPRTSSRRSCTISSSKPARRSARSTPGCCSRVSRRLPLRVERHGASAAAIADFLAERKEVVRVFYPGRDDHPQAELAKRQMAGGGPMVAFEVKGGKREAFRFMNALQIFKITQQSRRRQEPRHAPATTTHQRLTPEQRAELGIFDSSVRLSIGLEDVEDLKADLDQALRRQVTAAAPCSLQARMPPFGKTTADCVRMIMCRNIKTLYNFEPPATDEEIHLSSLQFVRKLSRLHPAVKGQPARLRSGGGQGLARGARADRFARHQRSTARPRGRGDKSPREIRRALPLGSDLGRGPTRERAALQQRGVQRVGLASGSAGAAEGRSSPSTPRARSRISKLIEFVENLLSRATALPRPDPLAGRREGEPVRHHRTG